MHTLHMLRTDLEIAKTAAPIMSLHRFFYLIRTFNNGSGGDRPHEHVTGSSAANKQSS